MIKFVIFKYSKALSFPVWKYRSNVLYLCKDVLCVRLECIKHLVYFIEFLKQLCQCLHEWGSRSSSNSSTATTSYRTYVCVARKVLFWCSNIVANIHGTNLNLCVFLTIIEQKKRRCYCLSLCKYTSKRDNAFYNYFKCSMVSVYFSSMYFWTIYYLDIGQEVVTSCLTLVHSLLILLLLIVHFLPMQTKKLQKHVCDSYFKAILF